MKFFIDTAMIDEIKEAKSLGVLDGVTTNPSLVAKTGRPFAGVALRVGSRWTLQDYLRPLSGPGQGLQPLAFGLGGAGGADFVAIDWSDGVFQSELDLAAGQQHRITETQRQLSSCPVLFAWDGRQHVFVSDLLGVGGLGYFLEPGVYAPPHPRENFLLPADLLVPRSTFPADG